MSRVRLRVAHDLVAQGVQCSIRWCCQPLVHKVTGRYKLVSVPKVPSSECKTHLHLSISAGSFSDEVNSMPTGQTHWLTDEGMVADPGRLQQWPLSVAAV